MTIVGPDWTRFESVQLPQLAVDGNVRYEVVHVLARLGGLAVLHREGLRPAEGVVRVPDRLAVADRQALHVGREVLGELLEGGELVTKLDLRPVEENRQDRLRRACVADHLLREEEVVMVVGRNRPVILLLPPLEEEHKAVHRTERLHTVGIERVQLLDLRANDPELRY